jgi:gas vesicle protein
MGPGRESIGGRTGWSLATIHDGQEDSTMNDTMQPRGGNCAAWTVLGVALGAALGAGVALLLAPESGKRTRERLGNTARDWTRRATETIDDARGAVSGLGEDARSAFQAGQESFAHDRAARAVEPAAKPAGKDPVSR